MTATIHDLRSITPRRAAHYAELLASSRDPRDIRARGEYLVRAHGGQDAEIVSFDGTTATLSSRVLTAPECQSVGIPIADAHPPVQRTTKPQGRAFTSFLAVMVLLILGLLGWALLTDTTARAAATLDQAKVWQVTHGEPLPLP